MKICFIGPANSSHIAKWCKWFSSHGHIIHVISFTSGEIDGAIVHLVDISIDTNGSDLAKIKYLLSGKKIRKIIDDIDPDIINVHYATSYGAAVALSRIKGYVLSVWGSDIYEFPKKSIFHRLLLEYSLKKAGHLFSTSRAMATEASRYTDRDFVITPFGVDLTLFNPLKRTRTRGDDEKTFIVGTVKSLSDKYGIEYILHAVSAIKKIGVIPIKLRIAGTGPKEDEYKLLAERLEIGDITDWLGFIDQNRAAEEWANMDVAIIPSLQESFGVSAVEAQACGTAVIISDCPGLMEATNPFESSIVVKRNESEEIVAAIQRLYSNNEERKKLADNGLQYVRERYELNYCFEQILSYFKDIVFNS